MLPTAETEIEYDKAASFVVPEKPVYRKKPVYDFIKRIYL